MKSKQLSFLEEPALNSVAIENHADTGNTYLGVIDDIPINLPNNTYIWIDRDTPLKIHSVGFQPAKSIPEIPRWFIQKYTSVGDTILEPFSGSGTSIIESLKLARKVIWLDYQPLSRLICQVKTTRIPLTTLTEQIPDFIQRVTTTHQVTQTINFKNKDFWFQQPVQQSLEIIRNEILQLPVLFQSIFWLAFASTVRKCSDMNDGMILAARRSNIKEVPKREREDVYAYFNHYLCKIIDALDEWYRVSNWDVKQVQRSTCDDARSLEGDWNCDAVVTSPPYANAIDYVWASKFELHWLGLVQNDEDRLRLYTKEIGTERIPASECRELGETGNTTLDNIINDVYSGAKYRATVGQNKLRARVLYKYFIDMGKHFYACYKKLRAGGHYCFAIGDVSKICGVDVPVAQLLTEFAEEIGFKEVFRFHLLLKNRRLNIPRNVEWASTIKHDTIVVLKKG